MHLEVISRPAATPSAHPPLLFIPGSCHGAWCWSEHFLGWFAARGFDAHAMSLRGHGQSDGANIRWTPIARYVDDVASVAATLRTPPIVIGHSLGGMVVQRYLERHTAPGAVLVAPAPSTGMLLGGLSLLRREPTLIVTPIVTGRVTSALHDVERIHRILFSPATPRADVARYAALMGEESFVAFAELVARRPRVRRGITPMLVVGSHADRIIRPRDVAATARAWGAELTMFDGMGHDMMLDAGWERVAERIAGWMRDEG